MPYSSAAYSRRVLVTCEGTEGIGVAGRGVAYHNTTIGDPLDVVEINEETRRASKL